MGSNPINDDFLAVTGLKDCHVVVLGTSGNAHNRLAVNAKLETGNYIVKAAWIPGSQVRLAVITGEFVKVGICLDSSNCSMKLNDYPIMEN